MTEMTPRVAVVTGASRGIGRAVAGACLTVTLTMAVYAATKNAVRTLLETLRAESTHGVLRTTAISPGYIRTELAGSMSDPVIQDQIRSSMDALGIPPEAVTRTIVFAIEQPADVDIGEITIRPTAQGPPPGPSRPADPNGPSGSR